MYFYVFVIEHLKKIRLLDKQLFESVFESVCAPAQFLSCRFRCNQAEEQTILAVLHLCKKLPCRVLSSRKWQIPPEPLQEHHCTVHYFVKASAAGLTSRVAVASRLLL